eukprot:700640-Rhodomonas_salina.1
MPFATTSQSRHKQARLLTVARGLPLLAWTAGQGNDLTTAFETQRFKYPGTHANTRRLAILLFQCQGRFKSLDQAVFSSGGRKSDRKGLLKGGRKRDCQQFLQWHHQGRAPRSRLCRSFLGALKA